MNGASSSSLMDKDQLQIYRGRFDQIPDQKLNSVRLFLSSTFSDTTEERNGLIERVYPRLRNYCSTKYQIQFHYSDMRWGIQSSALNNHSTVDMCLEELDQCSRLSLATNCVIFLSHRYGSRLVPACISARVFDLLLSETENEERILLSQMYQLDTNYLDSKYFLRPIDDPQQWSLIEKQLQIILRKTAQLCYDEGQITEEERREFFISVTAQEIYRALDNNRLKSRRIVCFFRQLIDIDQLDSKYRETENLDEIEVLLNEVKTNLSRSIDPLDIYTYQVRWNDEEHRHEYLKQFYDDFFTAIQSQIDYHMMAHQASIPSELTNRILEHAIQCNSLIQRYFPRDDILDQVKNYIGSNSVVSPCLLLGESGTGKSSIMAKLVSEIPKWYPSNVSLSVIIRFLGVTPSSSDIRRPLISIIEQICKIYQWEIPSPMGNVKEILEDLLMKIPPNEQLVLLLDSIDQLQLSDLKNVSSHLPSRFSSSNVKLIISTIPQIEIDRNEINIAQQLRSIYEHRPSALIEIEVKPFDSSSADAVVHSWLEQDRRCLTDLQYQWLKTRFNSCYSLTPLLLSLLYDQTLRWHSFDQTIDSKFVAIKQTQHAIAYLFHQLGEKHGQLLFRRSMKYLQLSGGLNQLEIEDLLSYDDQILQSIFVHYLPPWNIFHLPSTLWIRIRNDMQKYLVEKEIDHVPCIYFYHRAFQYYRSMDTKDFVLENEEKEILEKNRLEYFAGQMKSTFDMSYSSKLMKKYHLTDPIISVDRCLTKDRKTKTFSLRRLRQLLININRYDFVHRWTIFNLDFLLAYLQCGDYRLSDLLYEFSVGAHDPDGELRLLLKQFERSTSIVNRFPMNFPFELIFHYSSSIDRLPELTSKLLEQCFAVCPLEMLTNNQRERSLVKHSFSRIVSLTIDVHRLFVFTDENQLSLFTHWFYESLRQGFYPKIFDDENEQFVQMLTQYPFICCLSTKNRFVILNAQTNHRSESIDGHRLISFINEEILLIISSSRSSVELWNCEKTIRLSTFDFSGETIDSCLYLKPLIEVTFQSNLLMRSYLSIDDQFQMKSHRIIQETLDDHSNHYSFNTDGVFYYSLNRSETSLMISSDRQVEKIRFSSTPNKVIFLNQSQSIGWLTSSSVEIFHPIFTKKIFQVFSLTPSKEYHSIHEHYWAGDFDGQFYFLACLDHREQSIDIYQWFYDENLQRFSHRLLTHLQLNFLIDQSVFRVGRFDGVQIYCSDGKDLHKYNATMLTYFPERKTLPSFTLHGNRWFVHSDRFLIHHDDDHFLQIFVIDGNNEMNARFSQQSVRDFTISKDLSSILLIDRFNSLRVSSLISSQLQWSNNSFEHDEIEIHSLTSSFLMINHSTKDIFHIDPSSSSMKHLIQFSMKISHMTMTSIDRLYLLSSDQRTIFEFHWTDPGFHQIPLKSFSSSEKIKQFVSIDEHLIFQTDQHQIYLWRSHKQSMIKLEKASNLTIKNHRLVLQAIDNQSLILYDLKRKLRGVISLTEDQIPLESMFLTDLNDQYLVYLDRERFLRVFRVEDGHEMSRIFLHSHVDSLIGIVHNHLFLSIEHRLCILKINDRKALLQSSDGQSALFGQTMWYECHEEHCQWF